MFAKKHITRPTPPRHAIIIKPRERERERLRHVLTLSRDVTTLRRRRRRIKAKDPLRVIHAIYILLCRSATYIPSSPFILEGFLSLCVCIYIRDCIDIISRCCWILYFLCFFFFFFSTCGKVEQNI